MRPTSQQESAGLSTPSPRASHDETVSPHPAFPVLVAVAADEYTAPSIQVAAALAAARGATPSLLYVMKVTPAATMEGDVGSAVLTQMLLDPVQHQRDERALRATCRADTGVAATWPFDIDVGNVATSIVTRAEQHRAQLIIMGLRHHGTIDHLLADDTLRNVTAIGTTPVLAIRPTLTTLPKTIVVAIDFSVASLRAARLARQLLAENGTMHLIFVESVEDRSVDEHEQGRRLIESRGVGAAFQEMHAMLDPAPGMSISMAKLFGNTVDELTAECAHLQPDLVAIGSQRHPFLQRLFLGSVTKALMDDGRWSMLITPPGSR